MTSLFRTSSLAAVLIAGTMALAPAAFAQDKVITHPQGETTISGVPAKVLTQDWAVYDDLVALGVPVAGVPSSNAPTYLGAIAADAEQIGSLFEPDFEAIAASESDVYFVAARSASAFETAKDILPTVDLSVNNGSIIDGLKANMVTLGTIFGLEDKAAELNAALDAKVAEVKAAAEGKGNALVIVTNASKLGVYGPDSRVSWVYNEAGMASALDSVKDGDHGGDAVSFEFLLEVNPDWVFVVDRDAGTGENAGAAAALLDNELFNQTTAAKEGQIVYLDSQASYISMHGYQGVMLLLDQVLAGLNG
ncbi:siderophore ABC transporter substrate-binding protein [Devosia sp. FJ2-5-3]|uniref:siderophore ABC transporter substrate-binding protein n=1 Tax=Devosia sp. FJ2-5-3 TaxID=2976680 RepID=UPI0023D8125D|nr:siderophore ABC transporter substrate-binding protein [Devosia sp. FJ2-5-3]WEJ58289.1 siderophore ABC transporter substrate-binding protein [Devosia sp. FJ2-5-3]